MFAQSTPPFSFTSDPRDTLGRQLELDQWLTKDPALGRVPDGRLAQERERIDKQIKSGAGTNASAIPGMIWQERGPSNTGGRTRAVLFDPNDPTHKKVWVGSPAGGLWYTNDITDANATWTPVSDSWESMIVTCLAADPSNPQVMYAGTGDGYWGGNGGGIWKTIDGGTTWSRLNGTIPGMSYGTLEGSLGYIQRLVVNNRGYIFAATRYGLVRSSDGGVNWQFTLAPSQGIGGVGPVTNDYNQDFVSDLEVGTDGIVYASLNTSRIFRANNFSGVTWTEITPAGVPTGGGRAELALAQSTNGASQVVYAVSRKYNSATYTQDIQWFRKSIDGGANWSVVTIPTYNSGEHFTNGNGDFALSLTVDPSNAAVVYAGGYGYGWFRSTTSGSSWSNALPTNNTSSYTYQQGLLLQPGNTSNAVLISDQGVAWTTGWGNATGSTAPVVQYRNAGYRVAEVNSAAMRPTPGGYYLLAAVRESGVLTLPNPGLSTATSPIYSSVNGTTQTFIDKDEPSLQIFNVYSGWYLYRNNTPFNLFVLNGWNSLNTSAYDSQSNTLYVAEYTDNAWTIKRATGIGGTLAYTNFALTDYPLKVTLGTSQQSLYVASINGIITRYTNLSQTTPTATVLTTGTTFPQFSYVSYIDVGASDNELLVTLSNYGVSSVWYTSNGGATWINKDPAGSGLPDVPVRVGMFNPQNRQQVFLGTDLGVWSTNDIREANPGWALSSTGMSLAKVNQLRYRASDGRLIAATGGRGIFESNTLDIPYTPSSISLTNVSTTTLCAGSPLSVSFITSGPAFVGTTNYELWISDANGSFATQRRIGTGTSSPLSGTLPTGSNALVYGTGYTVRLVVPDSEITSNNSLSLAVGQLSSSRITDRRTTEWYQSTYAPICPGDQVRLRATPTTGGGAIDSWQWSRDGTSIAGATSETYLAGQTGRYQVQLRQAGCTVQSTTYNVSINTSVSTYVTTRLDGLPQCDNVPVQLMTDYAGEQAALQWQFNGVVISGATSGSYTATQSGSYGVNLSSSGCSSYTNARFVSVGRVLLARLELYPKADSVLCAGPSTGAISLSAGNIYSSMLGSGGYSITWYRDNMPINNQTNTYMYADEPGRYTFELRQGDCVTKSNAIVISQGLISRPEVNFYSSKMACMGDSRTMSIQSAGYWSQQWQKDGVDIPNATGNSYIAQTTGSYTVRVTRSACSATSLPVAITFTNSLTPVINIQGSESQRCSNIWIDVNSYTAQPGTEVQWYRYNVAIPGATSSNFNTTQTGLYSVSVTSGSCGGLSKPVLITPFTPVKPRLLIGQTRACPGGTVELRPYEHWGALQWKRDGVVVPGATGMVYYPVQSGRYSVLVMGCNVALESDPVEIKIGEPTAATIAGTALVSSGQVAMLPIALSGPAPWSFTLSNGQAVENTYLNPYPLAVTPSVTTTYSVAAVQNACGTGTVFGQSTVTVGSGSADLTLSSMVSSRTPKVNDVVSYSLIITNESQQEASGVQVTSRLPAGVDFVDAQTGGVSVTDGVVSINVGTVGAGSNTIVSYRLRITQPGTFFTTAQIAATNTPDPDSQPNSGTGDGQDDAASVDLRTADAAGTLVASTNPNQIPLPPTRSSQPPVDANTVELALSLSSAMLAPQLYDVISLSLIVSNRGGARATNLALQTVLPAGWQLTNIAGLVVTGQTVTAYVPQLAAGGKAVVVLQMQVGTPGSSQIQAQILDVTEPVSNARPGNGYQNGERDEASLVMRVR
ncbi:hypothetical protein [Fibrella aquatica]|uniref:hypothetical protein n=1 Tax=Fibrella aquatica TaxID=3242487 RepID=UPI003522CC1D